MKKLIAVMSLILVFLVFIAADKPEEIKPVKVSTDTEKLSYALGLEIGNSLKQLDTEIVMESFTRAIEDVLKGREPAISEKEAAELKRTFFEQLREEQQKQRNIKAEENRVKAEEFMRKNAEKEGVKKTDSGLQYIVLEEGNGKQPSETSKVKVHYTGKLIDGTVFDSSVERGEPAVFELNKVIGGWTEGIQLMKVGAKYQFIIPPHLGYGKRGAGQQIGPNEVLIFDVELLEIVE